MSLAERLANLHLLLSAPSFSGWPLELRFFAEDVYQVWEKRCRDLGNDLKQHMPVFFDTPTATALSGGTETAGGFASLDPSYQPMKGHVEKSLFLLAEGEDASCTVCQAKVDSAQSVLVCPMPGCNSTSHMSCLATRFQAEKRSNDILPRSGTCPSCRSELQWVDMVKELSLRTRGGKEIAKLQKKRRAKSKPTSKGPVLLEDNGVSDDELDSELDDELDAEIGVDVVDEPRRFEAIDDDDALSTASGYSSASEPPGQQKSRTKTTYKLDQVVEDSEWEGAEVVD